MSTSLRLETYCDPEWGHFWFEWMHPEREVSHHPTAPAFGDHRRGGTHVLEWRQGGSRHRTDGGPASIWRPQGTTLHVRWFRRGGTTRPDGPSEVVSTGYAAWTDTTGTLLVDATAPH